MNKQQCSCPDIGYMIIYKHDTGHKRCHCPPIRIKVSKFDKKAETLKRSMSLFALPVGREMLQIYKIVSTIQSMCQ